MGELKEVTTNKRASIRESDHEARITAWPLHYLLLKGERDDDKREPQQPEHSYKPRATAKNSV